MLKNSIYIFCILLFEAPYAFSAKIYFGKAGPTAFEYKCYMETSFVIQDGGVLNATTKTYSNLMRIMGPGFTGGVFMSLMDSEKKNLWNSQLHVYNVKSGMSRVDNWTETVPSDIYQSIKYYGIVHGLGPTPSQVPEWVVKNKPKLFADAKENAEPIMVGKN